MNRLPTELQFLISDFAFDKRLIDRRAFWRAIKQLIRGWKMAALDACFRGYITMDDCGYAGYRLNQQDYDWMYQGGRYDVIYRSLSLRDSYYSNFR